MPRFNFFATPVDHERLVAAHDWLDKLSLVRDTIYFEEPIPWIHGWSALPSLGVLPKMRYGYTSGPDYRVFADPGPVRFRPMTPYQGQKRFELDGNTFNAFLTLEPNGLFEEKTILTGYLEVTNNAGETLPLYKAIAKCFAKEFTKAKYCGMILTLVLTPCRCKNMAIGCAPIPTSAPLMISS
jgi:hypothetical protein